MEARNVSADTMERIEIALHMKRKIEGMKIPSGLQKKVYADMESQIVREFGISHGNPLQRRHLYGAHDLIDDYVLPKVLMEELQLINGESEEW